MTVPSVVRAYPSSGTLGTNGATHTGNIDTTGLGSNGAVVVAFSYTARAIGGGNVTGASVSSITLGGVAMTQLVAWVQNGGSATAGAALYGMIAPASGATQSLSIAMTGGSAGAPAITVDVVCLQDCTSFGNVGSYVGTITTTDQNVSVTASTNALAVAGGFHGDTITGAASGTALAGVVNNYSTESAGGCGVAGTKTGAGGSTTLGFTSSLSDHWTIHAVEAVGTAGAGDVTPSPTSPGHPADAFGFTLWQGTDNGVTTQDYTVTSSAFAAAITLSGTALVEPSAVSLAAVGVLPQSGAARPEPSAITTARVGVLGQAGAASPSPSAVSQALAGILPLASSARPEPAAATLALVGIRPTSLPTSTADLTVVGLAVVGVVVTSLPIPAPSAATIALTGVQARSQPTVEPSAISRAYIGTQALSVPTVSVTASGLALVGIRTTSLPTAVTDITVASLALVGVTTRSSGNTITVTGSALAPVGVQARSVPTITTTASGLIVVGAQPRSQAQVEWIVVARSYVGAYLYGLVGLPDLGPYAPADNRVLQVIRTSYVAVDPRRPSRVLNVKRPSYVVVVLVDRPSRTD